MNNTIKLSFQRDGTPFSEEFNDIYFDSKSGYQQSEDIFIQGNISNYKSNSQTQILESLASSVWKNLLYQKHN